MPIETETEWMLTLDLSVYQSIDAYPKDLLLLMTVIKTRPQVSKQMELLDYLEDAAYGKPIDPNVLRNCKRELLGYLSTLPSLVG